MKRTYFLLVCVALAFAALGATLYTRASDQHSTNAMICRSENTLRKILHDEHERTLAKSIAFLKANPNGIPGISRDLILQGIQDERNIVSKTAPNLCR